MNVGRVLIMSFDWLSEPTLQELLRLLGKARVAGGAVRNGLMGLDVHEVDIATAYEPQEVMLRARAAGFGVHPTGLQHGTVTVAKNGQAFEVTTLRRDVVSDGRHAQVAFTDDWQEDAKRRDFTMNALYCDAQGQVFDPIGGLSDIAARRVRFVGEPSQRIREDYLRILRFFRFFAQYGAGDIDASGLAACAAEKQGLVQLSSERITQELLKLLVAPRASEALGFMQQCGVLQFILPEARLADFQHLQALDQREDFAPDVILRLVVLAPNVEVAEKLRLSRAQMKRFCAILSAEKPVLTHIKQQIYRQTPDIFRANLKRHWQAEWREALQVLENWAVPEMPVKAADLMAFGFTPGPELGQALRQIEDEWLQSDFTKGMAELLLPYHKDLKS